MSERTDGTPLFVKWGEWLVALSLTLVLIVVHAVLWKSTGGLWRDENTTANAISSCTSYVDMWRNNQLDSFPILFGTFLRTWINIGFGDSDFALRGFGFVVSLVNLAALWLIARELRIGTPLLSLLLFACLPTTVRFGSSVRGYGLGVFWLLMALWAVFRLLREPNRKNVVIYTLMSLAAVQSYYTNCLMILAMSIGGGVVCLTTRAWRTLAVLVVSGLISLASMLPYIPTIQFQKQWCDIQQMPVTGGLLVRKFLESLENGWPPAIWVWMGALCMMLIGTLRTLAGWRARSAEERRITLFAIVTIVAAAVGNLIYFMLLSVQTSPWYYLALLAIAAVLSDAAISLFIWRSTWIRQLRLLLVPLAAFGLLSADFEQAQHRLTNVDLVADRLGSKAAENDLILLTHWQTAITFERYYHGKAPWMTVPELKTRRQQAYPEYRKKMTETDALDSVLKAVEKTLSHGGRVWLADGGIPPAFKAMPGQGWIVFDAAMPPAPLSPTRWQHPPYDFYWRNTTLNLLVTRSLDSRTYDDWGPQQIFPAERLDLHMFSGWRPADTNGS